MLTDIVIDTNVLLHADNSQELRQKDAKELLLSLWKAETLLCVDEGFDTDEARNRSQIGSEYFDKLKHGMLGYAIVAYLASSERVKMVSRNVPSPISRTIRRLVGDVSDHKFVRVAYNTDDKTLASHDFRHFPEPVRIEFSRTIGVHIYSAGEALPLLE